MKKSLIFTLLIVSALASIFMLTSADDVWGFFGHRRINRMAVFTLPTEMICFYKPNIEYITAHAVDPDKRRYATKHEAVRHYIDIDMYGKAPFEDLPREWTEALMAWTDLEVINSQGDTSLLFTEKPSKRIEGAEKEDLYALNSSLFQKNTAAITHEKFKPFFKKSILSNYYEDEWTCDCDILQNFLDNEFKNCEKVIVEDHLSHAGIIPWHLMMMKNRLTKAFEDGNAKAILRNSAEYGHYIGDAHVPLHTTENYNGQLTDQVGIHGFWESRIPELFADDMYDFFVGKAEYIDDPQAYFWDVVLESHSYLDSVLLIEKRLSETFPEDLQYCYDERLGRTIRTQCKEYAAAYQNALNGLQEIRMRDAILSVGSVWYTCWVDAGAPDLRKLMMTENDIADEKENTKQLDEKVQGGEIFGRPH